MPLHSIYKHTLQTFVKNYSDVVMCTFDTYEIYKSENHSFNKTIIYYKTAIRFSLIFFVVMIVKKFERFLYQIFKNDSIFISVLKFIHS